MTKATTKTTSHRTAGELIPCLQCHHGRYSSTTPHHAATWAQDHDGNHGQAFITRRRNLQAKLARTPPSGSRPLDRENLLPCNLTPNSI
jgi:hypothetical protein